MTEVKGKMVPASCPECEIGPFTRNHYFTGKLLVERDFRQEQAYYIDKLRLHTQRLHGWGVVCGLKVKRHEIQACRNRFVCIEPGLAVDCCGHDILVTEQDCIDLTQLEAIKALAKNNDTSPHTLQVCIRYKECPSEPIPVLYDDCGCDDTQCAPNRILESYEVDVNVVTQTTSPSPDSPELDWKNTINVAHASRVAYHDSTRRLYVLTDDAQGFVYQVSTDNFAILSSHALGHRGLALAVSNDGTRVYAIAEGANPGDPRQLHVLDVTQAGLPLVQANPLAVPNSTNSVVLPTVSPAPDNRLLALVGTTGDLLRWETDIDNNNPNPSDPKQIGLSLGANQQSFVLSTDGSRAFVGGADNKIQVLVLATPPATMISVLPAGAVPFAMAIVQTSSGDMLAVVDQGQSKCYLVNPAGPSLAGTVPLTHPPVGEVIAPDDHWAYVVEQDAGKSYLEPVDLFSLQLGQSAASGKAIPLGANSQAPVISSSGHTLFVPFTGNLATPTDGGVAILDATESDCCGKIWNSLDGCPSCDTPNCVVLATIKNYVLGDVFEDQTDPPADPATDTTNHVVRIDNREGRRLLPSTSTLTEIIQCLCAEGGGTKGPKGDPGLTGPPGKDGTNGLGIDDVRAAFVTCDQPGSAQIVMHDAARTLELQIPDCCNKDLAHICAINWNHADKSKRMSSSDLVSRGLLIAFDQDIQATDINPESVHVLAPQRSVPSAENQSLLCWCELPGKLLAIRFKPDLTVNSNGTCIITAQNAPTSPPATGLARGIQFIPASIPRLALEFGLRVVINGDLIRSKDSKGVMRGIDLDHLPEWLPKRLTGDGIEGGVFLSNLFIDG